RLQARTAVTAPAPPPAPGTGVPGGQWAHGPAHAAPKRTRRPDAPVRRVPGTAAGWRAGRVSRGRSWAQDLGRGGTRDGPRRQDPTRRRDQTRRRDPTRRQDPTRRRDRTPRPGRALRRAPAWPRARPTVPGPSPTPGQRPPPQAPDDIRPRGRVSAPPTPSPGPRRPRRRAGRGAGRRLPSRGGPVPPPGTARPG